MKVGYVKQGVVITMLSIFVSNTHYKHQLMSTNLISEFDVGPHPAIFNQMKVPFEGNTIYR